ncbi:MAG TPA: phosphatidate cytidylyltransferase, partial [Methylocella sp.]|nr:phosphatidate cytidylyltransferase [Methylocella sp.]
MRNDAAPGGSAPPPRFSGRQSWADLLPRIVSAIALMAAALISVWQGGLVFNLIWLGAAVAVGAEWQILIKAPRPRLRVLAIAAALFASSYAVHAGFFGAAFAILACGGLAAALAAGPERRLWAFGGAAYAGVLLMSVSALHGSAEFGARAVLWLFAAVWGTDVFAYFGG